MALQCIAFEGVSTTRITFALMSLDRLPPLVTLIRDQSGAMLSKTAEIGKNGQPPLRFAQLVDLLG